jgi:hypothetical protein
LVRVPNTKVVKNIQIYLHAKFHIFLRFQNISFYLFSHLLEKSKWKGFTGRFPLLWHASTVPRPISTREPTCLPLPHRRHLQTRPTHRGHLPPPPQILPSRALVDIAAVIPATTPSTSHHPYVARMPACAPATLSHCIGCGAL